MIRTMLLTSWWNLRHDKVALILSFALPIVFFSIFAFVFGGKQGGSKTPAIKVVLVDQDQSEYSKLFSETVQAEAALETLTTYKEGDAEVAYTEESAREAVRGGKAPLAIILRKGLRESVGFSSSAEPAVDLLYDPADPRALPTVHGLLQSIGMKAKPDIMVERGMEMFQEFGGPLTEQQKFALSVLDQGGGNSGSGGGEILPIRSESVIAAQDNSDVPNMICYYAAGVSVMFLLFSMSAAGGSLLEEEENGTLDRLLTSQLGMNRLILGKWLFFSLFGTAQLFTMFLWAAIAFDLPLFDLKHLLGFTVITLPLACAAAAFGLLLATAARSRAQLSGFSTVIILIMSLLGGSMLPRFLMPSVMQQLGRFTLNGWAIDGYLKVFWRETPGSGLIEAVTYLLPEIGAVSLIGGLFLAGSIWLSRRWKAV